MLKKLPIILLTMAFFLFFSACQSKDDSSVYSAQGDSYLTGAESEEELKNAEQAVSSGGSAEVSAVSRADAQNKQEPAAVLPEFAFAQAFPLEMDYKGAKFTVADAAVSQIELVEDNITFLLSLSVVRQNDTLAGDKMFAVRLRWYDSLGIQVHTTTAATNAVGIGQDGYGQSMISIPNVGGDYLISLEEIK